MRDGWRGLARRVGQRLIEIADVPPIGEQVCVRLRQAQRATGPFAVEWAESEDGSDIAVVRAGGHELRLIFTRPAD